MAANAGAYAGVWRWRKTVTLARWAFRCLFRDEPIQHSAAAPRVDASDGGIRCRRILVADQHDASRARVPLPVRYRNLFSRSPGSSLRAFPETSRAARSNATGMSSLSKPAGDRETPTLDDRFAAHARDWHVKVDEIRWTETSQLGFGTRDNRPVVLKVIRRENSEEWQCGRVLEAFGGAGVIRPIAHSPGAVPASAPYPGQRTGLTQSCGP